MYILTLILGICAGYLYSNRKKKAVEKQKTQEQSPYLDSYWRNNPDVMNNSLKNEKFPTSKLELANANNEKKTTNETEISKSIKSNIDKTLLAEIDISDATFAACCAVGGKAIMENTLGLMDSLSYGFDTLSSLCPKATLHRGIYEDEKQSLRLYTLVSGLKIPQKRLDQFKLNIVGGEFDSKNPL